MNNNSNSNNQSDTFDNSRVNCDGYSSKKIDGISVNVSKQLAAAAGFNVETPIVNAIIGNIEGTLPTKKNDTAETIRCDVCSCEVFSDVMLKFHINGSKHKKKLKALDIIAQLKAEGEKGVHVGDSDNPNAFRCEVCCLTVNSAQQLRIHLTGAKHKKNAGKAGVAEPESNDNTDSADNSPPPKKKKKEERRVLGCNVCNVTMNSQIQYDQHLSSKKHMVKVNSLSKNERFRFGNQQSMGSYGQRFQSNANSFLANKRPFPSNYDNYFIKSV